MLGSQDGIQARVLGRQDLFCSPLGSHPLLLLQAQPLRLAGPVLQLSLPPSEQVSKGAGMVPGTKDRGSGSVCQ